jgi:hypothetical protein
LHIDSNSRRYSIKFDDENRLRISGASSNQLSFFQEVEETTVAVAAVKQDPAQEAEEEEEEGDTTTTMVVMSETDEQMQYSLEVDEHTETVVLEDPSR